LSLAGVRPAQRLIHCSENSPSPIGRLEGADCTPRGHPAPKYGRLRDQRAPVRPLGARFAGLVAPPPEKEEGRGHFHPSGVPLWAIDAALKKNVSDWFHEPRLGGQARPATEVAPDTAKSAFADPRVVPRGWHAFHSRWWPAGPWILRPGGDGEAPLFSSALAAPRHGEPGLRRAIEASKRCYARGGGGTRTAATVAPDIAKSAFAGTKLNLLSG